MATFQGFGKMLQAMFTGSTVVDWDTDSAAGATGGTVMMSLYTANGTIVQDTTQFISDVGTAMECTGSGYNAMGTPVTGRSVTLDTTNNRVGLVGADVTWTTATISNIRYAVVYKYTGTSTTSPVIATADLGAQSVTGANFTVDVTNGTIAYLTY